jgi:hypothetical protein
MPYAQRFVPTLLHGLYRYWRRVRLSPVFPFLVIVLIQVYLWGGFLTETHRNPASSLLVTTDTVAIVAGVAILVFAARPEGPIAYLFLALLNAASLLLVDFSFFYWSHGTNVNFSQPLSHLDAVYFTVGTLSTAGTGNISATSEWSRGVQTAQMFIDMAFVLFGLAFLVSRLATKNKWEVRSQVRKQLVNAGVLGGKSPFGTSPPGPTSTEVGGAAAPAPQEAQVGHTDTQESPSPRTVAGNDDEGT